MGAAPPHRGGAGRCLTSWERQRGTFYELQSAAVGPGGKPGLPPWPAPPPRQPQDGHPLHGEPRWEREAALRQTWKGSPTHTHTAPWPASPEWARGSNGRGRAPCGPGIRVGPILSPASGAAPPGQTWQPLDHGPLALPCLKGAPRGTRLDLARLRGGRVKGSPSVHLSCPLRSLSSRGALVPKLPELWWELEGGIARGRTLCHRDLRHPRGVPPAAAGHLPLSSPPRACQGEVEGGALPSHFKEAVPGAGGGGRD